MQLPSNYELLYDKQLISRTVEQLALKLEEWCRLEFARSTKQAVLVAPMRGSLFFAADLVRQVKTSLEIRTITASSYTNNQPDAELELSQLGCTLRDRLVVFADEICDSGRTLVALTGLAKQEQAYQIKSMALVLREHPALKFRPDQVGLTYHGSEWLVGYGMDDNDYFRNAPQIYKINGKTC